MAAYYVVAYWKGLANNGMTPEYRDALEPDGPEWKLRVNGSKTHVIGLLLYMTVLWLLKGCWIAYYMRLTFVFLLFPPLPLPVGHSLLGRNFG